MLAAAINLNHHARVPAHLIKEIEKPRAQQILNHLLTLCSPQKPEVWVDQGLIGRTLKIHRDTVGRHIRYLQRIGYLAFVGFLKDGRRKCYRIDLSQNKENPPPAEPALKPQDTTSGIFAGRPQANRSDDLRHFCRTINKEEKTELKQQPVVPFKEKEFSSNQKIALKQKLKAIGVFRHSSERLLAKYPQEQIELQITHLQFLLDRGDHIEKPASWLLRAVEQNYALPSEIDPKAQAEAQANENLRESTRIALKAKSALDEGHLSQANDLATKSLQIAKNATAENVLKEIKNLSEKEQKIQAAKAIISQERLISMRKEEEQKELIKMRRWGKSDAEILSSTFFKTMIDALLNERLLAAGA